MDFFSNLEFFQFFFIHVNHYTSKNTKKSVVLKKVLIHSKSPIRFWSFSGSFFIKVFFIKERVNCSIKYTDAVARRCSVTST